MTVKNSESGICYNYSNAPCYYMQQSYIADKNSEGMQGVS